VSSGLGEIPAHWEVKRIRHLVNHKEISELPGTRFAVIVDEAHSSQSGESTKSLKAVLASDSLEEAEAREAGAQTPEDDRCLLCHTTAAQDPDALFAVTLDQQEGVGCETCQGPGSEYQAADVMSDRSAFLAAGGRIPDQQTCQTCHRNPERFNFDEWWPRIAHTQATE